MSDTHGPEAHPLPPGVNEPGAAASEDPAGAEGSGLGPTPGVVDSTWKARAAIARLEGELARAEDRHRSLLGYLASAEYQNTHLTYLYVTAYLLQTASDRSEVTSVVAETLTNLVGTEHFGIYVRAASADVLELARSSGRLDPGWSMIPLGSGALGEALARGEVLVAGEGQDRCGLAADGGLAALVPLMVDGEVAGAIAIFTLLPQKGGAFEPIDLEILDLLASTAAGAMYCHDTAVSPPAPESVA